METQFEVDRVDLELVSGVELAHDVQLSYGSFYVVDAYRPFVYSGPFNTAVQANDDRKKINVGDDCVVVLHTR